MYYIRKFFGIIHAVLYDLKKPYQKEKIVSDNRIGTPFRIVEKGLPNCECTEFLECENEKSLWYEKSGGKKLIEDYIKTPSFDDDMQDLAKHSRYQIKHLPQQYHRLFGSEKLVYLTDLELLSMGVYAQ